jgi:hypothetical protein
VKFSKTLPVIFTGDTEGKVNAYRTYGLDHEQVTNEAKIKRL